ncbi:hypothetical protein Bbelb_214580 [Branchiostoma belcheri]|nr:hypothetical protein Bbelb_214580 [Branchiostoma belcheri]
MARFCSKWLIWMILETCRAQHYYPYSSPSYNYESDSRSNQVSSLKVAWVPDCCQGWLLGSEDFTIDTPSDTSLYQASEEGAAAPNSFSTPTPAVLHGIFYSTTRFQGHALSQSRITEKIFNALYINIYEMR